MYEFKLKRGLPLIESIMDELINNPLVSLPDKSTSIRLGIYCKPLRDRRILNVLWDDKTNEKFASLKVNNVLRPGVVHKKNGGKQITYVFEDLLIPKI